MGVYDFSIVRDRRFFGINTDLRIDPNLISYPFDTRIQALKQPGCKSGRRMVDWCEQTIMTLISSNFIFSRFYSLTVKYFVLCIWTNDFVLALINTEDLKTEFYCNDCNDACNMLTTIKLCDYHWTLTHCRCRYMSYFTAKSSMVANDFMVLDGTRCTRSVCATKMQCKLWSDDNISRGTYSSEHQTKLKA